MNHLEMMLLALIVWRLFSFVKVDTTGYEVSFVKVGTIGHVKFSFHVLHFLMVRY